jgi:hypothetical protein
MPKEFRQFIMPGNVVAMAVGIHRRGATGPRSTDCCRPYGSDLSHRGLFGPLVPDTASAHYA